MKGETPRTAEGRYRVVCTWCGAVIRHGSHQESRGMCLRCFARIMDEHSRPQAQGVATPGRTGTR